MCLAVLLNANFLTLSISLVIYAPLLLLVAGTALLHLIVIALSHVLSIAFLRL